MREEKEIIYTDTYGPVYRYTRRFPRIVDNVRRNTAVNGVSIVIARAPGNEETIEDLGTIEDIDAAKVFSIPVEGVGLSDVMAAKAEKTSKGLKYTWDLAIPDQSCERPICPYTEIVLVRNRMRKGYNIMHSLKPGAQTNTFAFVYTGFGHDNGRRSLRFLCRSQQGPMAV